eukprot:CAMPEP_0180210130 /NCGR_PEP_ID=MMETSP0987-20121128/11910_1 /TAXON_ID=697907 /ORGANISM="non described non described, Strain CCMP2293" /LENGTH=245 /DNA_ID=CAMNT_0022166925 /DNA_START=267 /DNA_END=1007 /DNA_ORIENTATION=+
MRSAAASPPAARPLPRPEATVPPSSSFPPAARRWGTHDARGAPPSQRAGILSGGRNPAFLPIFVTLWKSLLILPSSAFILAWISFCFFLSSAVTFFFAASFDVNPLVAASIAASALSSLCFAFALAAPDALWRDDAARASSYGGPSPKSRSRTAPSFLSHGCYRCLSRCLSRRGAAPSSRGGGAMDAVNPGQDCVDFAHVARLPQLHGRVLPCTATRRARESEAEQQRRRSYQEVGAAHHDEAAG